ncbi:MAG TPA: MFS transporter [Gryllotalpicola sp.]
MSTTAPARTPAELRRWRNAVFAIFALNGLSISTWASRVPAVRQDLHATTDVIGLMLSGMSLGAILGLIVAPIVAHRLGLRRGMLMAQLASAVGLIIVGLGSTVGHSLSVVSLGLLFLGFGNGCIDVQMNVSAADVERHIGKTIMPLMHGFFSIGTIIGAGAGAAAAALHLSVFVHTIVMAVVMVAGVAASVRLVPEATNDATGSGEHIGFRARVAVWKDASLVLIGVVMLGMAFAEGSANDWIALAAVDGHGRTQAQGAAILDVFVIAMTIGRIAGGPLVDRIGRVTAIRVTAGLGIAGLLLFILAPAPWLYVVGAGLWGLGASLGFPLGMSAAADDERNATVRVASVAMVGYLAFLAGPPLIGFLAGDFGILNALYLIFALIVLAFVCAPAVRQRTFAKRDALGL